MNHLAVGGVFGEAVSPSQHGQRAERVELRGQRVESSPCKVHPIGHGTVGAKLQLIHPPGQFPDPLQRTAEDTPGGHGLQPGFGGAQPYAVMLTVIDMGDSISLQVTAPIVSALGITYSNFAALPTLVGIGAASSTAVLLGLATVWFHPWSRAAQGGQPAGSTALCS